MRGMTADDLFRVQWVSDVALSPDAALAVFVVTTLDADADEYRSAIWVVPAAGGPARRLTFGGRRDRQPVFSPDGALLAFVRDTGEKGTRPQLWVLPVDGGEAWQLTNEPSGASAPSWSPAGDALAFVSRVTPDDGLDEKERERRRARGRVIERLKYKFNGEGFTYDRPGTVRRVAVAPGPPAAATRLTDGAFSDSEPAWSPNGGRIAFVSARHENRDRDAVSDVWVMPADGGDPNRVTRSTGPAEMPRWSPDGRTIAFLGHDQPIGSGRSWRLWTVPADRSAAPVCLTGAFDRTLAEDALQWSEDGGHLWVVAEDQGARHLYRVPAGGGAPELVLGGRRQIASFAARGETVAFVATSDTEPAEVYVRDAGGERRLTALNDAWCAGVERPPMERFTCTSADGTPVEGWLIKPAGLEDGRRYPVLYSIHGGPFAAYGYRFFDEFQVLAGAGFGVCCVNFRGSSGYGERFATMLTGRAGELDYEDLVAGIDHAATVPWVDGDRLGVLGGSYGGYMTSWLIGHTDRFKAACSERAVNNWLSKLGTSDIGFLQYQQLGATPWEDPIALLHRSPIFFAGRITTPTLILHSENDLRCPIEQGEQLFTALQARGVPTRFVRFPEENHDLSRSGKPSRRVQRFEEQIAWFRRFLCGE
jgi:dipeptidyl aminopeptidase/acylaminoacyl peptidase